ncbi:hypothetical protein GCM10023147_50330 [Tsukamurella soli]|uniref:Gfo/Idh/MocA-like oxidoreductase C-terminal domain-containing protein n=1 Tax=Tsukamurella soli TaxID=644556 RepID=A0ABP8KGM8_9ACTN
MVTFASGATATITATTGAARNLGNRVSVIGETGAQGSVLELPEGAEGVNDVWTVPGEEEYHTLRPAPTNPGIDEINGGLVDFHTLQVRDFADAVAAGRPPVVTGRDARTSLAVVLAVYESSRTGTVVTLTPRSSPLTSGAAR